MEILSGTVKACQGFGYEQCNPGLCFLPFAPLGCKELIDSSKDLFVGRLECEAE